MEKSYDYLSTNDQRITIHFNKLFSPVKIFIDDEEYFKFSSKKKVSIGNQFKHEGNEVFVRYRNDEKKFEVRINGKFAKGSANHPNKFLPILAVGPMVYSVLTVILFTFNFILFSKTSNTYFFLAALTYLIMRVASSLFLILKLYFSYAFALTWFILEEVMELYIIILGGYIAIVFFIVKASVIIHLIMNWKKFKALRTYRRFAKKSKTEQLLDQF